MAAVTPLTKAYVANVFRGLEQEGQGAVFMNALAEDVHWTVKGTHPVAGIYDRKGFQGMLSD
jgi:ketosteroid isomerase-like protein